MTCFRPFFENESKKIGKNEKSRKIRYTHVKLSTIRGLKPAKTPHFPVRPREVIDILFCKNGPILASETIKIDHFQRYFKQLLTNLC